MPLTCQNETDILLTRYKNVDLVEIKCEFGNMFLLGILSMVKAVIDICQL